MLFYKVENNGNDFIITNEVIDKNKIIDLCKRNFSIGADGLIIIDKENNIIFYNSDGTEAKLCGNGLICISKFLSYKNNNNNNTVTFDNYKYTLVQDEDGNSTVNMPHPIMISYKDGYLVSMKNNHYIKIVKDINKHDFTDKDLQILKDNKCNLHYVSIENENQFYIKTFEYGANKTLSCGSGSIASFYTLNMLSLISNKANVITEGGNLNCFCKNNTYYLKGKASIIYKGEYYGF